jgi:ubiquitin carboxyl-terminal hydrolase 34
MIIEPVLPTSVTPHLNKSLLDRLLELLYISKNGLVSLTSNQLTVRSFETLLEASIHSTTFWSLFLSHLHESTLLQDVILDDPHPVIRKNATKQIVNKCTFIPRYALLYPTLYILVADWV